MLIIDEFHSMTAGTARKQLEVMNAVKLLCNEVRIPIVAVGTELAVNMLQTDPQHASRFRVVKLPKWDFNKDFWDLVADLEQTLPLRQPSRLSGMKTARAAAHVLRREPRLSAGGTGPMRPQSDRGEDGEDHPRTDQED